MMGRWCEEESVKREGRGLGVGFSGQGCVGVFLAVLIFTSSFFICLLVCFLCVLSWMKCLVFSYSAQRLGGLKAKIILHCLSVTLICCFSLAIYSLYCFGRQSLLPLLLLYRTLVSLSLSHFLSLSFGNFNTFYLCDQNMQERESEQRMETKQIHRRRMKISSVRLPP